MEGKHTKKVGSYHVTSQLLGQGTFSTVYLAYDRQHRPLAAKIIPLNFTTRTSSLTQNSKPNSSRKSTASRNANMKI